MIYRYLAFAFLPALLLAGPSLASTQSDIATYCKADVERLCKGIAPGGGRLLACLQKHSKEMSVGCAQALQKAKAD